MDFLKIAGKFLFKMILFLVLPVFTSLLLISLATGKFPPPLKELYTLTKVLKVQSSDAGLTPELLAKLAERQKLQNQWIDFEKSQASIVGNESPRHSEVQQQQLPQESQDLEKRIKALEYEVVYYKAKLARSEWEKAQLKKELRVSSNSK